MAIIKKIINWGRIKSPWVLHFNTGACNACDIEIIASLTPRYDLERFGVLLKGTPRHADILLCSGPVTKQVECRLLRIYEQMAEPKFVIAVGSCASSGGVFGCCYNVEGGIDTVIPVSIYIPGCPVNPQALIDGLVKLLASLEGPSPCMKDSKARDDLPIGKP
ncbi:MAG: NADH-quinone oxidoreductase subunit NuoB [Candidatus Omnitrophica bacterium]|nr:NADH-quinone oxidoreductase subunit NuoB [Candidatus Omnitrophota bacterium]